MRVKNKSPRLCLSGYTYTVVASSLKEGVING